MTDQQHQYETIVGLEVHAQLLTKSKLFCGDSIAYGSAPNTQVSPITLAHPGTLPKMNRTAIEFEIKMGLACHCEIEMQNYFARKNYFYPHRDPSPHDNIEVSGNLVSSSSSQ